MPIFEYKCKNCGKIFEVLVLSQNEVIFCENCKSKEIERIPSRFGFSSGENFSSSFSSGSCKSCTSNTCLSCKTK